MRILAVSDFYPWPEDSGGRMRFGTVVRALADVGTVDVFALASRSHEVPPPPHVSRFAVGTRASRAAGGLAWFATGRLPSALQRRHYREARASFTAWALPDFDVAWFRGAESHVALGDLVHAPCVVDLDDLEDQKLSSWLAGPAARGSRLREMGVLRSSLVRLRARLDRRRWRQLQHRIAGNVDAVTVCSELDRERLGVANAWVLPNGYAPPTRPVGRTEVGDPPAILFAGQFSYAPNLDGARYLIEDVLPRLRASIPDVEVRLVGRHDHRLERVTCEPGVTATGRVPEMTPELARADLVAVPARFGSGTRIKILEAFAHRIPVVSTSLGCEGLDVEPGRHLLVADSASDFAEACHALLRDVGLRAALAEAAYGLFRDRYRWDVIAPRVVTLATSVARADAAGGA